MTHMKIQHTNFQQVDNIGNLYKYLLNTPSFIVDICLLGFRVILFLMEFKFMVQAEQLAILIHLLLTLTHLI